MQISMNKKSLLKFFPESVRLKIIGLYLAGKRRRMKFVDAPEVLTFFVTRRCNLKCSHCFYWKEIESEKDPELTLPEIERIVPTLKSKVSLAITGGEPFLRKDLVEICSIFTKHKRVSAIGIATNGYLIEKIVSNCRQILASAPIPVSVQISLDGQEKTHDRIRGVKGSFRKAFQTLQALKQVRQDFPERIQLSIACALQRENIREIADFIDLVLPLQIPVKFLITRGESYGLFNLPKCLSSRIDPRERASAEIPTGELEEVFGIIERKNRESAFKFWDSKQAAIIRESLRMLKEKTKRLPCYAGALEGILYSNGEVSFCEFMQPIGNLRNERYDFHRLWNSENADKIRKVVVPRCFCIHSCALGTSLHLNSAEMVNVILRKR